MLAPTCEDCGGALRAVVADELEQARIEDADVRPTAARGDGLSVLGALVILPFLLPSIGVELADVAFAVPLVLLVVAGPGFLHLTRTDAGWRSVDAALAAASIAAAAGCAAAIATAVAGGEASVVPYYVAAAGSAGLLVASALLAHRSLVACGWAGLVDGLQASLVITALGAWFLVLPGFREGDVVLSLILAADLISLELFFIAALARYTGVDASVRPADWWLVTACAAATAGDALAVSGSPVLVAALWSVSGFALAAAADHGLGAERGSRRSASSRTGRGFMLRRVIAPLACVGTPPATALVLAGAHENGLDASGALYFAAFTFAALGLAFGRQAHLLAEHERAVHRERALREEATRRSDELEALTGLATTMTQTLEEAPIVEQALGVLHTAARATSAALHLDTPAGPRIAAAAGEWHSERTWAPARPTDAPDVARRGRREILRLPVAARGHRLGTVTAGAARERAVRRPRRRPAVPARRPDGRRGAERPRLPRAPRAGDPRSAHRPLQPALPARGARQGGPARRAVRLGGVAGDLRRRRLQARQRLARARRRRRGAARHRRARPAGDPPDRQLRPHRRRGVRAAAARDRPARGAAGRRARPSAVAGSQILPAAGDDQRRPGLAPDDAIGAEELQRLADGALYWAKRNGKDRCAVASDVTTEPAPAAPETCCATSTRSSRCSRTARAARPRRGGRRLRDGAGPAARPDAAACRACAGPRRCTRSGEVVLARAGFDEEAAWVGGIGSPRPGRPAGDEHPALATAFTRAGSVERAAPAAAALPHPMCSARSTRCWRRGASIGSVPAWLGRVMGRHADATELRPVRTGLRGGHAGRPAPARRAAPRGGAAVA
jgi:hypothetical protein